MNETRATLPAIETIAPKLPPYDPAFDATRMPELMGLAFEGVAISMTPDEATITIRYKKPEERHAESA